MNRVPNLKDSAQDLEHTVSSVNTAWCDYYLSKVQCECRVGGGEETGDVRLEESKEASWGKMGWAPYLDPSPPPGHLSASPAVTDVNGVLVSNHFLQFEKLFLWFLWTELRCQLCWVSPHLFLKDLHENDVAKTAVS